MPTLALTPNHGNGCQSADLHVVDSTRSIDREAATRLVDVEGLHDLVPAVGDPADSGQRHAVDARIVDDAKREYRRDSDPVAVAGFWDLPDHDVCPDYDGGRGEQFVSGDTRMDGKHGDTQQGIRRDDREYDIDGGQPNVHDADRSSLGVDLLHDICEQHAGSDEIQANSGRRGSVTTRILPYNEWHKLEQTNAKDSWRSFVKGVQMPIVAERDGKIIGQMVLQPVLHAECAGIVESERGGLVFGKLWEAAKQHAVEEFDVKSVWVSAIEEPMRGLIQHVNGKHIPGIHAFVSVVD